MTDLSHPQQADRFQALPPRPLDSAVPPEQSCQGGQGSSVVAQAAGLEV